MPSRRCSASSATTLATFGAVSKETATRWRPARWRSAGVDLTVSITGIAGPGGATPGKPVGLVHFARRSARRPLLHREKRFGAIGRTAVRQRSVVEALSMLTELARGPKSTENRVRNWCLPVEQGLALHARRARF